PIAMRTAILITDAPPHQQGESGDGTTDYTFKSMGDFLYEREVRLFTATPNKLTGYREMAKLTDGESFPLDSNFNAVLDKIGTTITNLYSLTYLSQSGLMPDSVRITLLRAEDNSPLTERKLV